LLNPRHCGLLTRGYPADCSYHFGQGIQASNFSEEKVLKQWAKIDHSEGIHIVITAVGVGNHSVRTKEERSTRKSDCRKET
jgi:hypothetical protein